MAEVRRTHPFGVLGFAVLSRTGAGASADSMACAMTERHTLPVQRKRIAVIAEYSITLSSHSCTVGFQLA